MRAALVLAVCLVCSSWAHAQSTQYVSDVVHVPVRSGAGNQYRIIFSNLRSGAAVTVLSQSEGGEWSQIRLASGTEGWVPSQYLTAKPTAGMQLENAQARLATATNRIAALEEELATMKREHGELSGLTAQQQSEGEACAEELKNLKVLSAGAVNLNERHRDLLAKYEMMQTERDSLRAENDQLKADRTVSQWLFGAGLLFAGMVLMLVLPALKPAKRNSDWVN